MIQRAEQFSPNSVEKDLAILEAVAERLRQKGHEIFTVPEDDPRGQGNTWGSSLLVLPQCIFSMSRLPATLYWLKTFHGIPIINSPEGVENCTRSTLETIMTQIGTPMPPKEGQDGYWLKRGDASAQTEGDVVYCKNEQELEQAKQTFASRGISDYVVSAHVEGDLVKFYGVRGAEGFFFYCYPNENGSMKFGDERRNGKPHHYVFDVSKLREDVFRVADVTSADFFGGDVIVRPDGSYVMIDFNDWPSYSICREEAAEAIASRFAERMEIKSKKVKR